MTTPTPKPLSPAAQKVLDAAMTQPILENWPHGILAVEIAAALRAVADQVTAETYEPPRNNNNRYIEGLADGKCLRNGDVRAEILSIAAELEGEV